MKLLIANVNPTATDEDVRAFILKYCGVTGGAIHREPGDGSRPVAIMDFPDQPSAVLHEFQRRLNGMFWNERSLNVQVM